MVRTVEDIQAYMQVPERIQVQAYIPVPEHKQVDIQVPERMQVLLEGIQAGIQVPEHMQAYIPVGMKVLAVQGRQAVIVHKQVLYHSSGLDNLTIEAPRHSKEELRLRPQVFFSFLGLLVFTLRNWFVQIVHFFAASLWNIAAI